VQTVSVSGNTKRTVQEEQHRTGNYRGNKRRRIFKVRKKKTGTCGHKRAKQRPKNCPNSQKEGPEGNQRSRCLQDCAAIRAISATPNQKKRRVNRRFRQEPAYPFKKSINHLKKKKGGEEREIVTRKSVRWRRPTNNRRQSPGECRR